MGARMRAHDWANSPLGPPEHWPEALKLATSIALTSRFPMVHWWGPDLIMLYNDAYRPMLGANKHPGGLGRPGIESWGEIWDIIGPQLRAVLERAEASWAEDLLLPMDRYGYLEEAYFTYSYSPIKHADGSIGGVFTAVSETTGRVLGERRLRTLRELAEQGAESRSVPAACEAFARTLGAGQPDVPFAVLYLLEDDGATARLVGTAGIAVDDPRIPASVARDAADDPWAIAAARHRGAPVVIEDAAARFGVLPGGVWPEPARQAVALPIARAGQNAGLAGVMVVGVNPRRALDDAYRGFLDLAAGHLATVIANARAYQEERRRAEALAELDRAKTTFFSNISHEFRTPLTLLLGPLEEALAAAALPPAQVERLTVAHRNGLRLLKLVNSLLDFSRIEAGRVQARFAPVDLATLTAELASVFRSATERAGLRLDIDRRTAARAGVRRSRHVGDGGAQPPLQRVQVHLRRRDRGRGAPERGWHRRRARSARHRHRHPRRTSCVACSSAFTASRARRAGPTKAPVSDSPWCRNWCGCTAARSGSKARPARAAASPSRSRSARRTCRRSRVAEAPAASSGRRARA